MKASLSQIQDSFSVSKDHFCPFIKPVLTSKIGVFNMIQTNKTWVFSKQITGSFFYGRNSQQRSSARAYFTSSLPPHFCSLGSALRIYIITIQLLYVCPALAYVLEKHFSSAKEVSFSLLASRMPLSELPYSNQLSEGCSLENDSHLLSRSPFTLGDRENPNKKMEGQRHS